jgi:hypothetical protein
MGSCFAQGETKGERGLAIDKASRFSQIAPEGWMGFPWPTSVLHYEGSIEFFEFAISNVGFQNPPPNSLTKLRAVDKSEKHQRYRVPN